VNKTAAAATAPSAVRKALDQLNQAPQLDPITAEEVAALGETMLWRILVEPYVPKYSGTVVLTDSIDNTERVVSKIARIVQIGCFAFKARTESGLELSQSTVLPKVGEYYLHEMYAGQEVHLRSGHILRLLADTELLYRVKDPALFKGYL
jgi:hypothetical protein